MKTLIHTIAAASLACGMALAAETVSYVNFIRQFQMPADVSWDASDSVAANGTKLSALPINPGGARFELWTMKSSSLTGLTEYPLESCYVSTYIPVCHVYIRTVEDPDPKKAIADTLARGEIPMPRMPRTRADQSFSVDIEIEGLRSGATDPEPSKSVKFFRHVQSYGAGGTDIGIDRTQATLLTQSSLTTNGTQTLTYIVNSIPGANRLKIRGEERYSLWSLKDYQAPESQLASQFIQVWPVADGTISGIVNNQVIKFTLPPLTLAFYDVYPGSTVYAQVYKGNPVLGTEGVIVPGSAWTNTDGVPKSPPVRPLTNYDSVFTSDGRWTLELITVTPFGTERMRTPSGAPAVVSFDLDRTINMNSSISTIE